MKFTGAAVLAAAFAQTASAHYIWEYVNGGAAYQYFRTNTNNNSPITDLSLTDLRCNVGASASGGSTGTLSVAAGGTVKVGTDQAVYHNGPIQFYLGKVPSGSTAATWDGSGANWFKFAAQGPTFSGGSVTWPLSQTYTVTLPASLPSGQWLLRVEQIGIHNPGSPPQFYTGCVQLAVTGGGSCSPSYFSIPGHVKDSDPGLTVNIYDPNFKSYSLPGPAIGSCSGGTGGGNTGGSPTTTTTARTTLATTTTRAGVTTTTSRAAATTTPAGGSGSGVALYGQCGGSGYTGPTTCAQGTCKKTNDYYSQCSP